ncbi:hypothetical protein PG995_005803 [Apiospora arundinis]
MDAGGSSSTKITDDLNAWWRAYSQVSPVTPAFSPYMIQALTASATWSAAPDGAAMTAGVIKEVVSRAEGVPSGLCTAATTISMSYSGGGNPHEAYSPMARHTHFDSHWRVLVATAYPPPILTSVLSGEVAAVGSAVGHYATSLSAGAGPPLDYGMHSPHLYNGVYGHWIDGHGSVWYNEGTAGPPSNVFLGENIHQHTRYCIKMGGKEKQRRAAIQ